MIRAIAVTVAAAALSGPPPTLFREGYDLCRAAPLAAIRDAGGQPYRRGLFANKSCLWERADLKAGVTLSTHPPQAGRTLMRQFLAQPGLHARRIAVPGATRAVIATLPHTLSQTATKYLLAAYPRGVVQINMNAPRTLPDARVLAVLRVVTRPG